MPDHGDIGCHVHVVLVDMDVAQSRIWVTGIANPSKKVFRLHGDKVYKLGLYILPT